MKLSVTKIFLIGLLVTGSGAQECTQISTCLECLSHGELDCSWIGDSCQDSCDAIADAACYNLINFQDMNEFEICVEADAVACGDSTDCVSCFDDTVFSCVWTAGECRAECDVADAACYDANTFPEATNGFEVCEAAGELPTPACDEATTCGSCLDSNNECTWFGDACGETCEQTADAACYDFASFPESNVEEICLAAREEACSFFGTCGECLSYEGGQCAWIGGEEICVPSCSYNPDFTCYSPEVLPDMSNSEICLLAGEVPACTDITDCFGCLTNPSEQPCAWMGDDTCVQQCDDKPDWTCYAESELPDQPPERICEFAGQPVPDNTMTEVDEAEGDDSDVPGGAPPPPGCDEATTCESCLEYGSECIWFGDACGVTCEETADAACYGFDSYPDSSIDEICLAAMEEACPTFATCGECLDYKGGACIWFGDACGVACEQTADAACYDVDSYPDSSVEEICLAAREEACAFFATCGECLDYEGGDCAWIGDGTCVPDCSYEPDITCYSREVLEDMPNKEICSLAGEGPDNSMVEVDEVEEDDSNVEGVPPPPEEANGPAATPDNTSAPASTPSAGVARNVLTPSLLILAVFIF